MANSNFWRAGEGAKAPNFNIANVVTFVRVVLLPVFVWLFWDTHPWQRGVAAFAVYFLAAATDKIDGQLARGRNLITDLGKLGDSIADKGLIAVALVMCSAHGLLWWWVTIIIIAREVFITGLKLMMADRKVIAAGHDGKVKMFLQSLGAGFLIFPEYVWPTVWLQQFFLWIGWIAIGVSVYYALTSAWQYVQEARRIGRE